MNEHVRQALTTMLQNWQRMQASDMDSAQDDADRFEASFYELIDQVREWMSGWEQKPTSAAEAMALPEIEAIVEELPGPLQLNFETEMELIVEGITREADEKYD